MTITRSDVSLWYELQRDTRDIINSDDLTNSGASLITDTPVSSHVGSYSFDGTNDSMSQTSSVQTSTGFTICGWVRTTESTNPLDIALYTSTTDDNEYWQLGLNAGGSYEVQLFSRNDANSSKLVGTTSINDGNWHFVVGVFGSSGREIYVDGSLEASDSVTIIPDNINKFIVGAFERNAGIERYSDMDLSQLLVFNKELSAAEVNTLYSSGEGVTARKQFPLTDGLEAYYKFDGNADDATGNGNNGTVNGATTTSPGRIGDAYSFDGTDDNVISDATLGISGNDARTISFWMKMDNLGSTGLHVINHGETGTTGESFGFNVDDTRNLNFFGWSSADFDTGFDISTGQWYHVVATYDGSTVRTYVDGAETSNSGQSRTLSTPSSNLHIAERMDGDKHFPGDVDEVGVWSRALTPGEVRRQYSYGVGLRYEDLDKEHPLNDAISAAYKSDTSGSYPDAKNNTNDGTITGATFTSGGKINGAYSFDGSNDFVQSNTLSLSSGSRTISMWVKPDNNTDDSYLFSSQNAINRHTIIWFPTNTTYNGFAARFDSGSGSNWATSSSVASTGNYHHVVAVYNDTAGETKLYVDGSLLDTVSATNPGSVSDFYIAQSGNGTSNFPGDIDELGVWSRALASSEVSDLYNSGNGQQFSYTFNIAGNRIRTINGIIQTVPTAIKDTK